MNARINDLKMGILVKFVNSVSFGVNNKNSIFSSVFLLSKYFCGYLFLGENETFTISFKMESPSTRAYFIKSPQYKQLLFSSINDNTTPCSL